MKAFLSHSSKDKEGYVRKVAEKIGDERFHYDELTFEKGEKSLDEILHALNETDLFVLFISNASLDSEWVQREINEANQRLKQKEIDKIYPIVIEEGITFDDPRIPNWLRDYNIRIIRKPTTAARNIVQKLTELSWRKHPQLEERQNLCIGRNNDVEIFEQRMDDYILDRPSVTFISGLTGIGRRTFLNEALYKTRIKKKAYKPNTIYLDSNSSIEDFILKLNDFGILDLKSETLCLSDKPMEGKINIVIKLLEEFHKYKDIVYIIDEGCIITHQRQVADWFVKILGKINFSYPILCCASKFKVYLHKHDDLIRDKCFELSLNELNFNERSRLFKRLLDVYDIEISKENFLLITENICGGFPAQSMFAISIIRSKGVNYLVNNLYELAEYNSSKASILLKKYEKDNDSLDFIRFLAQFEVITLSYIKSIVGSGKDQLLDELIDENICELLGINSEIIRLNDSIRDYIKRNRLQISEFYKSHIKIKTEEFLEDNSTFDKDSSEYIFSLKEALRSGKSIEPSLLIPSHYLKCMKDIYNEKGDSRRIIELADTILQKKHSLDPYIVRDIRYYLCLALIRRKDKRFMQEVQEIFGDEHNFLLGFYYRNVGRFSDALSKLVPISNKNYVGPRVKREMVQCYIQMEDYENALEYARNNWKESSLNPFHTQAYFYCLINSKDYMDYRGIIEKLIENLEHMDSTKANEMAAIAKALYFSKIEQNETKSFNHIDDAISTYSDTYYPILAKCDIAIKFKNIKALEEAVESLEIISKRRGEQVIRALNKYKAYMLALKGSKGAAIQLITNEINQYPEQNQKKIIRKIEELSF